MKNRLGKFAVAASAALLPVLALSPGSAQAAGFVRCTADAGQVCTTGIISANPSTHSLDMSTEALNGATDVTCFVTDQESLVEVGRLRVKRGYVHKIITGLYGAYWMGCYVNSSKGTVAGNLSNA